MRGPHGQELPGAVLFACTYVESAGVRAGELDPFAIEAMEEIGIEIGNYKPKRFEDLQDSSFDLVITLSPEAQHKAVDLTHTWAVEIEYWPTMDATALEGSREQKLDAYRAVRDELMRRIRARFEAKAASDT